MATYLSYFGLLMNNELVDLNAILGLIKELPVNTARLQEMLLPSHSLL